MGAQVYNQMIQRVHQSPAPPRMKMSMRPATSRVNRIKCNLFGKVESAVLKQFVEQELKEHNEAKSKKWGFDFSAGRPLENGTYEWESIQAVKPAVAPTMITLTQAAHVIPTTSAASRRVALIRRSNSSSTSSSPRPLSVEDLVDEWAKRANTSGGGVEDALNQSLSTTSTLSPAETTTASEESESELIETYPTPESSARIIRKIQRESPRRTQGTSPPRLRQPQITEFLKERKRLSSSTLKRVSAKKVRLMSDPSSGADRAGTSSSI